MKNTTKVVGALAIVGTIATIALLNEATLSSSIGLWEDPTDDDNVLAFNKYIAKHGKSYLTRAEFKARLSVFRNNLQIIASHNAADHRDFTLKMNG